jgi:hypothetical protein
MHDVTPHANTSYDPLASNTQSSVARALDNFHPQKHCVAFGRLELNAKQYSK